MFIRKAVDFSSIQFPRDQAKCEKWISAIKRVDWIPNDNTWICSTHFVTGVRSNNPLAPNYVPTIFPYTNSPVKRKLQNDAVRFKQRQVIKRRRVEANQSSSGIQNSESNTSIDVLSTADEHCSVYNNCDQSEYATVNVENNNEESSNGDCDVDIEECQQCIKYQKECDKNQQENTKLRLRVVGHDFLVDDVKTKYYTGLPSYELLQAVFKFITIGLPVSFQKGPCSVFQQFLMVPMKLQLNLGCQDLGY